MEEPRARWLFVYHKYRAHEAKRIVLGLIVLRVIVLGLAYDPDLPADDPLYPEMNGEFGVVLFGWFVGWWHDPGF